MGPDCLCVCASSNIFFALRPRTHLMRRVALRRFVIIFMAAAPIRQIVARQINAVKRVCRRGENVIRIS